MDRIDFPDTRETQPQTNWLDDELTTIWFCGAARRPTTGIPLLQRASLHAVSSPDGAVATATETQSPPAVPVESPVGTPVGTQHSGRAEPPPPEGQTPRETQPPPAPPPVQEPVSEIPAAREALRRAGITTDFRNGTAADTIVIGVYEPRYDGRGTHRQAVASVINHERVGLTPGAGLRFFEPEVNEASLDRYPATPAGLRSYIESWAAMGLTSMAEHVRNHCLGDVGAMRVFNVSSQTSRRFSYQDVMSELALNPQRNRETIVALMRASIERSADRSNAAERAAQMADRWIQGVRQRREEHEQWNRDHGSTAEPNASRLIGRGPESLALQQGVRATVDDVLDSSQVFSAALRNYQEATREAAENGVTIVTIAGNEGHPSEGFGSSADGSGYNFYAMSDHVIVVGAADIRRAPGNRGNTRVAELSSPGVPAGGGRRAWTPTLVAQGVGVPVVTSGLQNADGDNGTSLAAPMVSGVIGLMLRENPSLTFAQIRDILSSTSTRLDGSSAQYQGAGMLNVDRAVLEARRRRSQNN